ncbi:MAG: hypothetical protein NVS2B4_22800 [Ramlibacter sp.]
MIALASGLRVYLACGVTDMRKGMTGLAMLVQQGLSADPFDGAVFAFRGRRAGLIKLIWHDGIGRPARRLRVARAGAGAAAGTGGLKSRRSARKYLAATRRRRSSSRGAD